MTVESLTRTQMTFWKSCSRWVQVRKPDGLLRPLSCDETWGAITLKYFEKKLRGAWVRYRSLTLSTTGCRNEIWHREVDG